MHVPKTPLKGHIIVFLTTTCAIIPVAMGTWDATSDQNTRGTWDMTCGQDIEQGTEPVGLGPVLKEKQSNRNALG